MRTIVVVALCALLVSCKAAHPLTYEQRPTLLLNRLKSHVPEPRIDCGHAEGPEAASVVACIQQLIPKGSAFIATFPQRGIDSRVVVGLGSPSSHSFVLVTWDSDPSGGSGAGEKIIFDRSCDDPIIKTVGVWTSVECQPSDGAPNH